MGGAMDRGDAVHGPRADIRTGVPSRGSHCRPGVDEQALISVDLPALFSPSARGPFRPHVERDPVQGHPGNVLVISFISRTYSLIGSPLTSSRKSETPPPTEADRGTECNAFNAGRTAGSHELLVVLRRHLPIGDPDVPFVRDRRTDDPSSPSRPSAAGHGDAHRGLALVHGAVQDRPLPAWSRPSSPQGPAPWRPRPPSPGRTFAGRSRCNPGLQGLDGAERHVASLFASIGLILSSPTAEMKLPFILLAPCTLSQFAVSLPSSSSSKRCPSWP